MERREGEDEGEEGGGAETAQLPGATLKYCGAAQQLIKKDYI